MSDAQQEIVTRLPSPAPAQSTALTPAGIVQLAVEKGADVDQLERLLAMQERWEANEARKAFVVALSAFKADPPVITKNKHVGFGTSKGRTEYDHATLDNVVRLISPLLSANGLSHRWNTNNAGDTIEVTCILTHALGHSESVTLCGPSDQSGGKNSIQAVGSTVTYLQRYTLLAITGLASTDDVDGENAQTVNNAQIETLKKLIADSGADIQKFCQNFDIDALPALPAVAFHNAKRLLEMKIAQKGVSK